jgi:hypothetical protein
MTGKITAPFTDDQVKSLNAYQVSGVMHPFTCAHCRDQLGTYADGVFNDRLLVATNEGWTCPTCDTTQDWTWEWMADWKWESYKLPGIEYPKVVR